MKVEINITESRSRDFSAVFLHCKFLEPSSWSQAFQSFLLEASYFPCVNCKAGV
jgi:hypothetical protein